MRVLSITGAALLLTIGIATPVLADVFFQQAPGGGGNRSSSTLNFLGGSPGFRAADDFVLSSNATISDINFWGQLVSGSDDFTFTFYADNGGKPGTVLLATDGTVSTTVISPVLNAYTVDLSSAFTATAGTTYWLSIFNQGPQTNWAWDGSVVPGTSRQESNASPNTWASTTNFNLAFELEGTRSVPEPGSIALVLAGLFGLGFSRSRRAK